MDKVLDKYSSLSTKQADPKCSRLSGRVRRAWDRVKLEPDEIRDLRREITSNVTLLNAFVGGIIRDNVVKLVVQ